MGVLQGSWMPKFFGAIAALAGIASHFFPEYDWLLTPIAWTAGYMVAHVVRQDNVPSEATGAAKVLDEMNAIPAKDLR